MLSKIEIKQQLSEVGINVTMAKLTKAIKEAGFSASQDVYSDDEAIAIMQVLQPRQVADQKADSSALEKVMQQGEGAIANVFKAHFDQLNQELCGARDARDRYVDKASDALVTVLEETRPLVFYVAAQKLAAAQERSGYSLDAIVSEAGEAALPGSSPLLLSSGFPY